MSYDKPDSGGASKSIRTMFALLRGPLRIFGACAKRPGSLRRQTGATWKIAPRGGGNWTTTNRLGGLDEVTATIHAATLAPWQ